MQAHFHEILRDKNTIQRVYDCILSNPNIAASQIISKTNIKPGTVRGVLSDLYVWGYVKRNKKKSAYYYFASNEQGKVLHFPTTPKSMPELSIQEKAIQALKEIALGGN